MDQSTMAGSSRQGYTFQTALGQSMGLNHMHGRVEDAILGRFLSPDIVNQDPSDPQSYNPYTYVLNNPLSFTDPSGFLCQNQATYYAHNVPALSENIFSINTARSTWIQYSLPGSDQINLLELPPCPPSNDDSTFVFGLGDPPIDGPSYFPAQGSSSGGSGSSGVAPAAPAPVQPHQKPCLSINSGNVKAVLPAKSVGQQLADGFNSYFDGLGWGLTMFAANQGWLGSSIQGQANQIGQSLSNVGDVAWNHPQVTGSVLSAALQTYPWQVGARASTNYGVSRSLNIVSGGIISPKVSYGLAGAAMYGTAAHDAFAYGGALTRNDLIMAVVSGVICPRPK